MFRRSAWEDSVGSGRSAVGWCVASLTHLVSGSGEDTSSVNLMTIGIIGKCDGVVTMRRPAPVTGQQTREIGKSVPGLSEEEIDALVDDGVLQVPAEDPQR